MKLSEALAKVKDWDDLEWYDWFWVVVSVLLGGFMIGFSVIMPFQNWVVDTTGWYWLKAPAFISLFWLVLFALAHNTLTTSYSLIEKWHWNAVTIAIVLIVSAFVGLGGLAKEIWTVVTQHGGSSGSTLLLGIIVLGVAMIYLMVRRKK